MSEPQRSWYSASESMYTGCIRYTFHFPLPLPRSLPACPPATFAGCSCYVERCARCIAWREMTTVRLRMVTSSYTREADQPINNSLGGVLGPREREREKP